jgi:hypothetical protein
MLEARENARLGEEALPELQVVGEAGADPLEGDAPLEGLFEALEHLAHPPAAEWPHDADTTEPGTGVDGTSLRGRVARNLGSKARKPQV